MTFEPIPLAVSGTVLTAAYINAYLRGNLLETFPAKAGAAGDLAYGVSAGLIDVLPIGTPSQVLRVNVLGLPEWGLVHSGMITEAVGSPDDHYTAIESDGFLFVDATDGAITITLYSAVDNDGRKLFVQKADGTANAVTLDGDGTETIAGAATYDLADERQSVWVISDGANWQVIAASGVVGASAGHTIENEGVDMTARTQLNFVGSAVEVTDDAGNDRTIVTINAPAAAAALGEASVALSSGNVAVSSSSFAAVTGVSCTLTTTGGDVLLVTLLRLNAAANETFHLDILRDGTTYLSSGTGTPLADGFCRFIDNYTWEESKPLTFIDNAPSAGSHTYQLMARRSSGTATVVADGTSAKGLMWANELARETGGILDSVVSKTTTYTATTSDQVILASTSGGAWTLTLYAAGAAGGRRLTVKKTDSSLNALTIDANAGETIDGATTLLLYTQYESVVLECDGSNWQVVARELFKTPAARSRSSANITTTDNTLTPVTCDETDLYDVDGGVHFTSAAALSGTVTKTAASATLTGSGTSFTTELSVGQVISVPGTATEKRVVIAIASNTSLTVNTAYANSASGQVATRVNSAFVATRPGIWDLWGGLRWASNTTGLRLCSAILNDTTTIATVTAHPVQTGVTDQSISVPYPLARWDFIEIVGSQTSGGALDLLHSSPRFPAVGISWRGPSA